MTSWVRGMTSWAYRLAVAAILVTGGCRTCRAPQPKLGSASAPVCPSQLPAPPGLPDQRPEHELASFWLRASDDPQRVLMDEQAIAQHNARVMALRDGTWPNGRWSLLERPVDRAEIATQIEQRLAYLQQKVREGKALTADGTHPSGLVSRMRQALSSAEPIDELRVAWRSTPLRCYPFRRGLYETPELHAFDLGQCSQLRFGEPVRVILRLPQLWYVWTDYATGWVDPAALGPQIGPTQARQHLAADSRAVVAEDRVAVWNAPVKGELLGVARMGATFPLLAAPALGGPAQVLLPTKDGLKSGWIRRRQALTIGYAPLSRAALLQRAFALLGNPYGWGGMGDRRDCSRMLMDLFGSFGLLLPRNSSLQARSGQHQIDVEDLDEAGKTAAIERAAERGVVLIYFPGHIMLYLGRHGDKLYALHQFSGYLVPCAGGGETMYRANRTAVTSLDLGRGGSRRSFIERATRLVVFGGPDSEDAASQPTR